MRDKSGLIRVTVEANQPRRNFNAEDDEGRDRFDLDIFSSGRTEKKLLHPITIQSLNFYISTSFRLHTQNHPSHYNFTTFKRAAIHDVNNTIKSFEVVAKASVKRNI